MVGEVATGAFKRPIERLASGGSISPPICPTLPTKYGPIDPKAVLPTTFRKSHYVVLISEILICKNFFLMLHKSPYHGSCWTDPGEEDMDEEGTDRGEQDMCVEEATTAFQRSKEHPATWGSLEGYWSGLFSMMGPSHLSNWSYIAGENMGV
ncbi:hypothetical protein HZH66_003561 [Vespula vulgaris]|uniref:Uncharacterized protein n=1 Tax=Vespula vulgaris TaxID=7454 RepID=A0A834NC66_VESVU|nr:hypothetical protein HZH66_003561 [Vespula vulgaris]